LEVTRNFLHRLLERGSLHISQRVGDILLYARYCVHKGCTAEAYAVLDTLRKELTAMKLAKCAETTELERVNDLTEQIRTDSLDPL
jgi:hypothetical protein